MNWLAHVFLSEPDVEARLGNLLADLVKGKDRLAMSEGFLHGVACHQAIDRFTDSHPIVHRSQTRVSDTHRRFAGILVDVFYDNCLARNWASFSSVPLEVFTAEVSAAIKAHPIVVPEEAQLAVTRLLSPDDPLESYRRLEGIKKSLVRISQRLTRRVGRPFALQEAVSELEENYAGFEADFLEFFPALQAHVRRWQQEHPR